jgi:hypothetical protein
MQKKSWVFTGFTFITGAFAMFLRWLQRLNCFEAETGLFISGSIITVLLLAVLAVAVVGLLLLSIWIDRSSPITEPERILRTGKPFMNIIAGIVAAAVFIGGVKLCFEALQLSDLKQMFLVLALLTMASAISLFVLVRQLCAGKNDAAVQFCYAVVILFYCFWIITAYKQRASNPVVWEYAPGILALASCVLAFYFLAGYSYKTPKPGAAIFFSELSVVLCMTTLTDERGIAESIMLIAPALLLYAMAWLIIYNTANGKQDGTPTTEE